MKLNRKLNLVAGALALASLALAATPCKKAVKAVLANGGTCSMQNGAPVCSQASVTTQGSCSGGNSTTVCTTGTKNSTVPYWIPQNITDCSQGCVSFQNQTLTYTEAYDQTDACISTPIDPTGS